MYSVDVTFCIFAALSVILAGAFFVLSKKLEKLKRFVAPVALIIPVCFFVAYDNFINKVYILGKTNESYEYKVLLLPASFSFDNNKTVNLSPKLGSHKVIINNSENDAVFEAVVYGDATPQPDIQIPMNEIVFINRSVDYIFSTPPDVITLKTSGVTQGSLHYKVDNKQ